MAMQLRNVWLLIAFALVIAFIYYLSPILMPFLFAFILAYLTDPLVERLTHYKVPRIVAVIIVFSALLLFFIGLVILVLPLLERQLIILINKIPMMLTWLQQQALPWLDSKFGIKDALNVESARHFLSTHLEQAGTLLSTIWQTIFYSGYTLFIFFFNLLMIPVVTFYLLKDWVKINKAVFELVPTSYRALWNRLLGECDQVLGAFFRGQLLVMLSLGIFYSLSLQLMGLDLALLIGFIIGVISIVPYLGFIVGILLAVIAALVQFHDSTHLVYVLIIFLLGSALENMILAPLLVGDRIGLHPVVVIFAILAGGQLFGFTGILLALPVAAILMVLLRYAKEQYLERI